VKTTGEVNPPYYFFGSPESICGHSFCKTNALQYACEKYNVLLKNCIVIGDSVDDRCMVGHAGKGVAFCTNDELLEKMATRSIKEKSFESLIEMTSVDYYFNQLKNAYAKQTLQFTCPYDFTGKNKWAIAKAIEIANILIATFILYTLYTRP
jgi:hypothetical protein